MKGLDEALQLIQLIQDADRYKSLLASLKKEQDKNKALIENVCKIKEIEENLTKSKALNQQAENTLSMAKEKALKIREEALSVVEKEKNSLDEQKASFEQSRKEFNKHRQDSINSLKRQEEDLKKRITAGEKREIEASQLYQTGVDLKDTFTQKLETLKNL